LMLENTLTKLSRNLKQKSLARKANLDVLLD
jgi:hypothetical protein